MRHFNLIFALLFFLLVKGLVLAGEYQVDKEAKNEVKFISDAPIEEFEGVTNKIDGYLYYDDETLTEKSEMYFEVDLNSIDTGIGLRNRHMRENYLETEQYPVTYFSGKITSIADSSETIKKVTADGTIFIHGVEKKLTVRGIMSKTENGYNIKTGFIVKLSDFKIPIPQLMFMKIDENMQLKLNFYLKKISEK